MTTVCFKVALAGVVIVVVVVVVVVVVDDDGDELPPTAGMKTGTLVYGVPWQLNFFLFFIVLALWMALRVGCALLALLEFTSIRRRIQ